MVLVLTLAAVCDAPKLRASMANSKIDMYVSQKSGFPLQLQVLGIMCKLL